VRDMQRRPAGIGEDRSNWTDDYGRLGQDLRLPRSTTLRGEDRSGEQLFNPTVEVLAALVLLGMSRTAGQGQHVQRMPAASVSDGR
jgi:hypothetical protein